MLLLQLRPKLSSVREGILERVNFQEKRPKLLLRVELAEVFSMTKAHSEPSETSNRKKRTCIKGF